MKYSFEIEVATADGRTWCTHSVVVANRFFEAINEGMRLSATKLTQDGCFGPYEVTKLTMHKLKVKVS